MQNQDLIDLLLKVTNQQQNSVDVSDDELVDKLKMMTETVSVSESALTVTSNTHPAKWGSDAAPTVKWNIFTWG